MTKTAILTALISAAALSMSTPAVAQQHHPANSQPPTTQSESTSRGMMMGKGMMGRGMMECPMMGQSEGHPRTEGRLAFLKAELKITPDQENVWTTYEDALRSSHETMMDHRTQKHQTMMKKDAASPAGGRKTAPEVLQERIKMIEAMLANLKSMEAATSELYGELSQSQKATADEILNMSCGMMRL